MRKAVVVGISDQERTVNVGRADEVPQRVWLTAPRSCCSLRMVWKTNPSPPSSRLTRKPWAFDAVDLLRVVFLASRRTHRGLAAGRRCSTPRSKRRWFVRQPKRIRRTRHAGPPAPWQLKSASALQASGESGSVTVSNLNFIGSSKWAAIRVSPNR